MATPTTQQPIKRWLAAGALALTLAACGGSDDTPAALPLAVDTPNETDVVYAATDALPQADDDQVVSPPPSIVATTSTTTTVAPSTTTTSTAPTTTTTVPDAVAPVEPVIVIECATNPPHASVTFGDPEVALDWTVTAGQHPGGNSMPSITSEWGAGTVTPVEPLSFDINPNTLSITATTTNALGEEASTQVSVTRFSGCPVANSLASRVIDHIDCVTGAFLFAEYDAGEILVNGVPFEDGFVVDSVVVERWNGPDDTLAVNESGQYWVPGWDGPEEVKAVVTFTASDGTHEEHINHFCGGMPFGEGVGSDYDVCSDERLHIAYPAYLASNIDIDGPEGNSCSVFRAGGEDGHLSHEITITSLGNVGFDEAAQLLLPHESFSITGETIVTPSATANPSSGLRRDFERRGYEISHYGETELTVAFKVWLINVDGEMLKVETGYSGVDIIDGMVTSAQFIVQ